MPISTKPFGSESDNNYFILKGATYETGGITKLPAEGESPIWIPILKVKDVQSITTKAVELGGAILMKPRNSETNAVALIATPFGAPFLIQEWSN